MSAQVAKLEALLERVQRNRVQPRGAVAAAPVARKVPSVAPAGAEASFGDIDFDDAAAASNEASVRPEALPKRPSQPTPLELAMEAQVPVAKVPSVIPAPTIEAAPLGGPGIVRTEMPTLADVPKAKLADMPVPQIRRPASNEPLPERIIESSPPEPSSDVRPQKPQPSGPIIRTKGRAPVSSTSTFGELMRRTLSLRPR